MFENLVDKIHFDKPENHNIYKPNIRDDRLMTFNGEDFIVDNKALDTILTNLEHMIENNLNPEQNKTLLKKLRCHLKMKRTDDEYLEQTKDDKFNGRKMVNKTHKKN